MFKKTLIREDENGILNLDKQSSDGDMSVVPISVLSVELPGAEPHKLWWLGPGSLTPTAATLPAIYCLEGMSPMSAKHTFMEVKDTNYTKYCA